MQCPYTKITSKGSKVRSPNNTTHVKNELLFVPCGRMDRIVCTMYHTHNLHSNGDLRYFAINLLLFLHTKYSDVIRFFKRFEVLKLIVGNRDTRIQFQRYVVIVFNKLFSIFRKVERTCVHNFPHHKPTQTLLSTFC